MKDLIYNLYYSVSSVPLLHFRNRTVIIIFIIFTKLAIKWSLVHVEVSCSKVAGRLYATGRQSAPRVLARLPFPEQEWDSLIFIIHLPFHHAIVAPAVREKLL